MKRRIIILAALLALAAGCSPKERLQDGIQTGTYYVAELSGDQIYFCLDTLADRQGSGHYYKAGGGAIAVRQGFSVKQTRKKYIVTAGETVIKQKAGGSWYKPYVEPEYKQADTRLYRQKVSEVDVTEDVVFARVRGYWDSLPGVEEDVTKGFTSGYMKSFRHRDLDLKMDIYRPKDLEGIHPLILFIHGGAFYVGDKQEPAYIDFCKSFASMGYVTASMNYRMGFHAGKGEIERAGYVALQDAHAAMRFLVSNAEKYGIDTSEIYVAGSSAGSITALNLAYMTEEKRPRSSFGGKGLFNGEDLGRIAESGNDIKADFHIRAVANMWGAVNSLDILKDSHTDVISFHGELDEIVPFGEGYPFSNAGKLISQSLSDTMYGSYCIDKEAKSLGLRSEFYSFPDQGHAFNTSGTAKQPNSYHYLIKDRIKTFFYQEMVPVQARLTAGESGVYTLNTPVATASWKAEGGFIISNSTAGAEVLWRADEDVHKIWASGTYDNGIGYITSLDVNGEV